VERLGGFSRRWLLFSISFLGLLLWVGEPNPPLSKEEENPMEKREEKLKAFREKKDQFFKEVSRSPLKEADRKRFKGLIYYPIDLRYAMVGMIERYPTEPKPIYINLPTSKGKEKKYVKYGKFRFKWEDKEYVLQIVRPLGGGEFFLPFKDKTSGKETYSEGRYLYIEPMPGGKVLIDFNRAHNPFCQYNEKYICPIAPKENSLDTPIHAGEKRFR
jgi:uncharacterized protein (DUF1684 family)